MKKRTFGLLVLFLMIGVAGVFLIGTYAKYTSTAEQSGTATVAKWAFSTDNANDSLTISLAETYNATTLVNGKIAPGTEGSFNIALVNTNSEVGVDWTLTLDSITNKPTNLKFYRTRTGSGTYTYSNELTPGTSTITGQLTAGDSTGLTVPIYWKWEYETSEIATNDPIDTADGEAAATLDIGVSVVGTQVQPSTTAITSHIN